MEYESFWSVLSGGSSNLQFQVSVLQDVLLRPVITTYALLFGLSGDAQRTMRMNLRQRRCCCSARSLGISLDIQLP